MNLIVMISCLKENDFRRKQAISARNKGLAMHLEYCECEK